MEKYRFLIRNAAIISVGTLLSKCVVFFMVRFYTGILTPAEYGTGDLLITTVSLLTPFVSFGIADGVFRFLPEYAQDSKSVFSIGIYTIACGFALFSLLLPFFGHFADFRAYLPLLLLLTIASCCHAVCGQYVRAAGDTVLYALQGLLNTILVVTLNLLFLAKLDLGITGYVLSVGIADLGSTVFLIVKCRLWSQLTLRPDRTILRRMLRYSIPLIPTTVFWWITSASDRYMITFLLGGSANGIYTVANKLPTILTLFAGVLMQAWQYSAVREAGSTQENQVRFYTNVWQVFSSTMFLAASILIAGAKPEIRFLADEPYFEAWHYVPLLCAAMLFCAFTSFFGSVYTVTQKSGISFWTSFLGAAANILLNLLLIPSPLGIYGAAAATFFSYFLVFLVRARNARRWIPFRLFKKSLLLNTTVLTLQILFISCQWPCWQIMQVFAVAAVVFLNRKQIRAVLQVFSRTLTTKK